MKFELNEIKLNDAKCEKAVYQGTEVFSKEYRVDASYIDNQYKGYRLDYICPHCFAHLYAYLRYFDPRNKIEKKDMSFHNYTYRTNYEDEYYYTDRYGKHICTKSQKEYIDEAILKYRIKEVTPIAEEAVKFGQLTNCPICEGILSYSLPFAAQSGDNPSFYEMKPIFKKECIYERSFYDMSLGHVSNRHIPYLKEHSANFIVDIIKRDIDKEAKDKSLNFINCCNITFSSKTNNQINSPTQLKDYILHLINSESNIMSLSQLLEQLYIQKAYNDKDVVFERNYALYGLKQGIQSKSSRLKNSKEELSNFERQPISFKKKEYPSKPKYPTLKTPYFFNKKKVEAENAQTLQDYENALEKYNCDVKIVDADNEMNRINAETQKANQIKQMSDKIEKYASELISLQNQLDSKLSNKNCIPTKALGEKHLLDYEIHITEDALRETYKCRNELYSYNIVFDKYRNIVALSTFYEYLMAGRCEALDGVNGAYNIYENEIRLNTIITKLDEIKENQFMIYNKLRDIDNSLNTLNNTMEKAVSSLDTISKNTSDMNVYLDNISKNTAVIAHNSAVTAYYSKVNAELTNALGFMVALK